MKGHIKPHYQKRLLHRLKIVQGQIRGLVGMVEDEQYCIDILNQSSAVQESLKSFDTLMLDNHLRTHIAPRSSNTADEKYLQELLKIYKFKNK
ncbi:metal-sensitive transcriptional regulator [Candidatus Falkowbacteria bacterium]|nr:metal-sensitive transcriptional regulator [Candidatus Falkowbacteria bacterium]